MQFKTKTLKKTLNPVINESVHFDVADNGEVVHVVSWDADVVSKNGGF